MMFVRKRRKKIYKLFFVFLVLSERGDIAYINYNNFFYFREHLIISYYIFNSGRYFTISCTLKVCNYEFYFQGVFVEPVETILTTIFYFLMRFNHQINVILNCFLII